MLATKYFMVILFYGHAQLLCFVAAIFYIIPRPDDDSSWSIYKNSKNAHENVENQQNVILFVIMRR